MKNIKIVLVFIVSALILNSCSYEAGLKIRCSIKSENGTSVTAEIIPENNMGCIANGAVVYVTDCFNQITMASYNNSMGVYKAVELNPLSDFFYVSVISAALSKPYEIQIPHNVISVKPEIVAMTDSLNNNVFSGNELDVNEEIQIGWEKCDGEVVYDVKIQTQFLTVWTGSTSVNYISVPSKNLEEGKSYTVSVCAQRIIGDPLFLNCDYSSVSTFNSSKVNFYTK